MAEVHLICILSLPMLLPVALGYECKYNYEHDRPVANCKGLNLTSVPQNLSVNIVGLDLSQNNIHEIVNDSFAKYRNLNTREWVLRSGKSKGIIYIREQCKYFVRKWRQYS